MLNDPTKATATWPPPDPTHKHRPSSPEKRLAALPEAFAATFGAMVAEAEHATYQAAQTIEAAPEAAPRVETTTATPQHDSLPRVQPAMAETWDSYQAARAIATDPRRPASVEALKAAAQTRLDVANGHAQRARRNAGMLPESDRAASLAALRNEEHLVEARRADLGALDAPGHPAVDAARAFEEEHPDIDRAVADLRTEISAEVLSYGSSLGFVEDMPDGLPAGEQWSYCASVAAALAYRERNGITGADPLGPEPQHPSRQEVYHAVATSLAQIGVQVSADGLSAEKVREAAAAYSRGQRLSLNAAVREYEGITY